MSKAKWFSCKFCGTSFQAHPPDYLHPKASLEKPKEAQGSIIPITYDCKNKECMKPITLYWYRPKMGFVIG